MEQLTSKQCLQLANRLTFILSAIGDYRHNNFNHLSDKQNEDFQASMIALSDAAGILYAYTPLIALDEVQPSLDNLKTATDEINNIEKTIGNVQKWINITGAALSLATAILSNDAKGIKNGISNVADSIKEGN